jgi:hypothetical protein
VDWFTIGTNGGPYNLIIKHATISFSRIVFRFLCKTSAITLFPFQKWKETCSKNVQKCIKKISIVRIANPKAKEIQAVPERDRKSSCLDKC